MVHDLLLRKLLLYMALGESVVSRPISSGSDIIEAFSASNISAHCVRFLARIPSGTLTSGSRSVILENSGATKKSIKLSCICGRELFPRSINALTLMHLKMGLLVSIIKLWPILLPFFLFISLHEKFFLHHPRPIFGDRKSPRRIGDIGALHDGSH